MIIKHNKLIYYLQFGCLVQVICLHTQSIKYLLHMTAINQLGPLSAIPEHLSSCIIHPARVSYNLEERCAGA